MKKHDVNAAIVEANELSSLAKKLVLVEYVISELPRKGKPVGDVLDLKDAIKRTGIIWVASDRERWIEKYGIDVGDEE